MMRVLSQRAIAATILAGLSAWNAPAMPLPARIQGTASCAEPAPVAQAEPVSPVAHQHHSGMHHGMAMPVTPPVQMSVAECFQQHTCCSFNREPGKKSEPAAVSDAQAASGRLEQETASSGQSWSTGVAALPPVRAVFDLKSDMRI